MWAAGGWSVLHVDRVEENVLPPPLVTHLLPPVLWCVPRGVPSLGVTLKVLSSGTVHRPPPAAHHAHVH